MPDYRRLGARDKKMYVSTEAEAETPRHSCRRSAPASRSHEIEGRTFSSRLK